MKRKCWRHAEGFTLLEVMVALAIIAVTLVTYIHSQNMSIALLNESANMTTATLLAKGRMVALESGETPSLEEREGSFKEEEYASFRWKERLVASPLKDILEVHVEVSWDDNRGRRSVELVSLVVRK